MAGQNVVPSDVVRGEGKGRQQGSEHADCVQAQYVAAEQADYQSNSCHRQSDRRDTLQRRFLQSAGNRIEQYPDRSGVLQDNRRGNIRPLDRQVIKIVGRSYSRNTDEEKLAKITSGHRQRPRRDP